MKDHPTPAGVELEQLILVFVGSPTCSACKMEGVPEAIGTLIEKLRETADGDFRSIGVANSRTPREGIEYLQGVAPWDEVISGMSWRNSGSIKYFWEKGIRVQTPAILVFSRRLLFTGQALRVEESLPVLMLTGATQILTAAETGIRPRVPVFQ